MRTIEDAQRSVQRYLAGHFPSWEVRPYADEGTFTLPSIIVRLNGSASITGSPQMQTVEQPIRVLAYQVPADSVSESNVGALRVQETLQRLLAQGDGGLGKPFRLPLWDWDGIALDDADTEPTRWERDYLRLAPPLAFTVLNDSSDQRLAIVQADLRLSWGRRPRADVPSTLVQSVVVRQHPS